MLPIGGCGPPKTVYVGDAPDWKSLPQVDHPEYVHWSKFPIGTFVVRKKEASNENGNVEVITRVSLVARTDSQIALEQRVSIHDVDGIQDKPPQRLVFPATFPLPQEMSLEQFQLPAMSAVRQGEEELAIAGQNVPTEVYAWEEVNEAGPMPVKYWQSDEVPGRLVRQEAKILSNGDQIVEQVAEIHIPEVKSPTESAGLPKETDSEE